MKRLLLFLSLVAIFVSLSAQTGKLPYKKVIQAYRGDTLYTEFDGDSVRVVTNKKWAFNPEVSGGETLGNPSVSNMLLKSTTAGVRSWGWTDRIRNYNLEDTFSVLRTVPAGKIGHYTRSVSGYYSKIDTVLAGGYAGLVDANYGYVGYVNTNNVDGYVGKVSTNYGYVWRVGTNNAGGHVGFVDANYGYVWRVGTNNANGNVGFVDTNYGYVWRVGTNNAGGYVGIVGTNNANGHVGFVGTNYGYVWRVGTNNANGNVGFVDTNSGYVGRVNTNSGYVGYIGTNNGICNTVKNAKSNTPGAHSIISAQVYYDNIQKWYRDSIGLSHGEIPSATGQDTTVNLSVDLTANTWVKVTNSTNNLWSLSNTASYMTFSNDTIINTYAGKYEYHFNLSINGKDGATYEYRVRKKTGATVSTIRKLKVTGAGVNSERMIDCMPLLSAGDRVWIEFRFTGAPTGSPVLIFGSYFTAKAVYLSL